MKHHDISTGDKGPKSKALEGAKRLSVQRPDRQPTPGIRSEDEFVAHMKKTPGKYEGYVKRRELNEKNDSNGYGRKLLEGYQAASRKKALDNSK